MIITEANIEITRHDGVLSSVSVVMPSWNKVGDDGVISVVLPFFGLKTFVNSDEEAQVAIEEAIKCFCIATEKHGNGLDSELIELGWKSVSESKEANEHKLFDYTIDDDNFVLEQVFQTAEQFAQADLAIA